jgi:hypothetical protein
LTVVDLLLIHAKLRKKRRKDVMPDCPIDIFGVAQPGAHGSFERPIAGAIHPPAWRRIFDFGTRS